MDVIVLGVYNKKDISSIEETAAFNGLKVVWDYCRFNIEAEKGIKEMEKYYQLFQTGILIEGSHLEGATFYSEPIINEISNYYVATEWNNESHVPPKLFRFFNALNKSILKNLIVAFADEWNENTTVKIERISFNEVNSRLNNFYVWCFGYRDLRTNSEIRDDFHPLILEMEKAD